MYIVKLWEKCWIAQWTGDPGRTVVEENAKRYDSEKSALGAARQAMKYKHYRPYMEPEIVEVNTPCAIS